ncbi:MAG: polysaccharide deacetylase family protein [Nostocaceae cyanobacterium]|nr:polysaccharide deacetylase family protein [Nostocaceae cyanobacterium]
MDNKKSFMWSQGILMALVALGGTLSFGLMIPVKSNILEKTSSQTIKSESAIAQLGTQKRVEEFKTAMLTTWQQQAKAKGLDYGVPKRFQGVTIEQAKISPGKKVIALTFDDGPWKTYTAQVLDILKKNDVKATFFVVGQMLKIYPDLGKRMVKEGHAIGNHTWNHRYHYFNREAAAFEIDNTSKLIYQVTGARTTLFRPPGGMLHNGLVAYAKSKKYTNVMWSADSIDYKRPPASALVNRVIKQSKPGGIVLMHDGGGNRANTVAALPKMIKEYKKQGYSFVTIPELLEMEHKHQQVMLSKKGTQKTNASKK